MYSSVFEFLSLPVVDEELESLVPTAIDQACEAVRNSRRAQGEENEKEAAKEAYLLIMYALRLACQARGVPMPAQTNWFRIYDARAFYVPTPTDNHAYTSVVEVLSIPPIDMELSKASRDATAKAFHAFKAVGPLKGRPEYGQAVRDCLSLERKALDLILAARGLPPANEQRVRWMNSFTAERWFMEHRGHSGHW